MTFLITYNYGERKNKQTRVKNSSSEDDAKYKLYGYLYKKYGDDKLTVLACVPEMMSNGDINDFFGGIFS
jgi:hypothetical protein